MAEMILNWKHMVYTPTICEWIKNDYQIKNAMHNVLGQFVYTSYLH